MFALTTNTLAKLTALTNRLERHGDEDVPAVTFSFKITGPNTVLDEFGTPYDFRHAFYTAPEGQEQIEGIDSTPLLRSPGMGVVTLDVPKHEGWTLVIDHGINEDAPLEFGNGSLSKFKCTPFQGGSCELAFIFSTDDVNAEHVGLAAMKLGQVIPIRLLKPEPKPDAIDGSVEAFEADHPDAGQLFAEAHADAAEEIAELEAEER
jgi:hypothetical protein